MTYYAHTKEDIITKQLLPKSDWQLLRDHLLQVATLAEERASKFGAQKLGRIAGLTHDLGKYSTAFQKRLAGSHERVDHSTAGAQEVTQRFKNIVGRALAYIIAGHHGGLPDGHAGSPSNLPERLSQKDIPDYSAFAHEINIPEVTPEDLKGMPKGAKGMEAFSLSFCIRMLYSCLVDADFLNTERHMDIEKHSLRNKSISINSLFHRFQKTLDELAERNRKNSNKINTARQAILERCLAMAASKPGFFTLTVPTGGGKTYSSLAFALKHAVSKHKQRIIYVIPYTSIIEQNAQVFRDALGADAVLEHHSNFEYPEGRFDDWNDDEKVHRLASENWEKPVVVTTAVQFFESLYANKGSRCRKLHNMVNSVIILDEAQMLPIEYMKPCLWALSELVLNYGATVVLCTATQPAVKELIPGGINVTEIMEDPIELQRIFKRVSVQYGNAMSDAELSEAMASTPQVLTIVNTRRHARLLFDKLTENVQDGIYHLSARMCPSHRKEVLSQIREALDDGLPCRTVSTQLIEAGVDVDFPRVFRAAAGIDSIAQAAGRCNREGRLSEGQVTVFDPEPHGMPSKGGFCTAAGLMRSVVRQLHRFDNNLLSLKAIEEYFQQLLDLKQDSLDSQGILRMIRESGSEMKFPFKIIAQKFQLIDRPTVSVVIPWDRKAEKLMQEAENHPYPASMARSLQPYVVQIYQHELRALAKEGVIKSIGECMLFLTDPAYYDARFGLKDPKEVNILDEILIL